uniref:Scaffolding protein n=1 Tax=Haemonchus contortus TaxID=6289 RepID=A0A7I4YDL7_HAECO
MTGLFKSRRLNGLNVVTMKIPSNRRVVIHALLVAVDYCTSALASQPDRQTANQPSAIRVGRRPFTQSATQESMKFKETGDEIGQGIEKLCAALR